MKTWKTGTILTPAQKGAQTRKTKKLLEQAGIILAAQDWEAGARVYNGPFDVTYAFFYLRNRFQVDTPAFVKRLEQQRFAADTMAEALFVGGFAVAMKLTRRSDGTFRPTLELEVRPA